MQMNLGVYNKLGKQTSIIKVFFSNNYLRVNGLNNN